MKLKEAANSDLEDAIEDWFGVERLLSSL